MAITTGVVGSWTRTVGVKIEMDEAISLLDPTDVPLQSRLSRVPTSSIKNEWMEEGLLPQAVTVSGTPSDFTGSPAKGNVTFADASELRVGDVLQIKDDATYSKQYVVTALSSSTVVELTVFGSSTVKPADTNVLILIGQVPIEGGAPKDARSVERVAKYNLTQIGQEKVEATRTQRKRAMYAQSDPYDHEVMKKFKELAIRFERSLILGYRYESSDAKQRMMGGALYFTTTNATSNTKANVKTAVNAFVRSLYDATSSPGTTLMCSPNVLAAITANWDPTLRRMDVSTSTLGEVTETIRTDFGNLTLVLNRWLPKTKAVVVSPASRIRTYDEYFHELLAKTGDSDQGQIVGEFTCEFKDEKRGGVLTITDA